MSTAIYFYIAIGIVVIGVVLWFIWPRKKLNFCELCFRLKGMKNYERITLYIVITKDQRTKNYLCLKHAEKLKSKGAIVNLI